MTFLDRISATVDQDMKETAKRVLTLTSALRAMQTRVWARARARARWHVHPSVAPHTDIVSIPSGRSNASVTMGGSKIEMGVVQIFKNAT